MSACTAPSAMKCNTERGDSLLSTQQLYAAVAIWNAPPRSAMQLHATALTSTSYLLAGIREGNVVRTHVIVVASKVHSPLCSFYMHSKCGWMAARATLLRVTQGEHP
jgi:hypothetical protein